MNLGLPRSMIASGVVHSVLLLLILWMGALWRSSLPAITEITLVSGNGTPSGPQGAGVPEATAGGRHGTTRTRAVRTGKHPKVTMATPEFMTLGRKPRRSGEELMGSGSGDGGGQPGTAMGTGPAGGGAGRKVTFSTKPEMPRWAEEQGIVAKVRLWFQVLPDGSVDPQIVVKRTSGYRELDQLAIKAMRQWEFEPLPPGSPAQKQPGEIEMSFVTE